MFYIVAAEFFQETVYLVGIRLKKENITTNGTKLCYVFLYVSNWKNIVFLFLEPMNYTMTVTHVTHTPCKFRDKQFLSNTPVCIKWCIIQHSLSNKLLVKLFFDAMFSYSTLNYLEYQHSFNNWGLSLISETT